MRDEAGRIVLLRGTAQDITDRKRAEEELRESEEKFRSVFRDAGMGMVIVSVDGHFLSANDAFCECLGYSEEELRERTVESITLPEDWPGFSRRLREAVERGSGFRRFEKRCLHKSGRIVYIESSASLIRGPNGEPRYFVGEVLDLTERKRAEETLLNVKRKLVEAQEQERARIARDLHDDVNQRLALLAVEIDQMKQEPPSDERLSERLGQISKQTEEILADIQAISHQLHSSKLEQLGIVVAMKSLCEEVSAQHGAEVRFSHDQIPSAIAPDISLCLFRVLQEALHNAVKHSGVRQFDAQLRARPGELSLRVSDAGAGFDPDAMVSHKGLGLISMSERLHLVHGAIVIYSKPGHGTTIEARVPLVVHDKFRAAAV